MSRIIVYGKQGCGKTTRISQFAAEYPEHSIVDDWDGKTQLEANTLALTHMPPPYAVEYDRLITMHRDGSLVIND